MRVSDKAVQHYAASREVLREPLKQACLRDRDLDEQVTEEWAAVDSEGWRHIEDERKRNRGHC